jgi:hypothetical protein
MQFTPSHYFLENHLILATNTRLGTPNFSILLSLSLLYAQQSSHQKTKFLTLSLSLSLTHTYKSKRSEITILYKSYVDFTP